ncbi:coiled-coil domain-containing protein [Plantactinospora sp. CA-290183]|uniref:coiled-coil domain-containing protein n=1 Tax=Plantactinospora sp. CA-290183 TaxID=3240006 RepID=UPI003D8F67E1
MTASGRRRCTLALTVVVVVGALAGAVLRPGAGSASPPPGVPGDEGGTPLLRDVLEATGRGYVQARTALARSQARQARLATELREVQDRIAELGPEIDLLARNAYRTGRIGPVLALLNSSSTDDFLERARGLETMALWDNHRLHELNQARERASRAKLALDAEVTEARRQVAVMQRQKREAERALALVGGRSTGGFVAADSPVARPAPRNGDGSWPRQSCGRADPTTSGCVTPRTLHAYTEARRAGFKRYTSCYRPGGPYEHPKGRACDFSSAPGGFGGDAHGADKTYGNNLAAFFVRNADRLGVLYVIWYRQIWFPATGWKSYGASHGDPSSDHTNHVHLSLL